MRSKLNGTLQSIYSVIIVLGIYNFIRTVWWKASNWTVANMSHTSNLSLWGKEVGQFGIFFLFLLHKTFNLKLGVSNLQPNCTRVLFAIFSFHCTEVFMINFFEKLSRNTFFLLDRHQIFFIEYLTQNVMLHVKSHVTKHVFWWLLILIGGLSEEKLSLMP